MTMPLLKPKLPQLPKLSAYLQEIDRQRIYGNFGPHEQELRQRLAMYWNLSPGTVATTVNATIGLMQALWAVTESEELREGKICLVPAWTFTASAAAVVAVGMKPCFVDVDPQTWALTPMIVDQALKQVTQPVGAVMVVAPFGAPLNTEVWDLWSLRTGIPVVIDAAAAFDTIRPGDSPCIVSFHATKVLGAGEGGCIASRNLDLIKRLTQMSVFGFQGDRISHNFGINTKISEYTAAILLAALDAWPVTRTLWFSGAQHYRRLLAANFGSAYEIQIGWGHSWISSTLNLRFYNHPWQVVQERLANAGIESRPWWPGLLPTHSAYSPYQTLRTPNAEVLEHQTLGLPFYIDMTTQDIEKVCEVIHESTHL